MYIVQNNIYEYDNIINWQQAIQYNILITAIRRDVGLMESELVCLQVYFNHMLKIDARAVSERCFSPEGALLMRWNKRR